jgi:HK97 family phage prohead protease
MDSTSPSETRRERRNLMAGVELRAPKGEMGPGMMVGYAAVFDKFSVDLGSFREKIAAGAFRDCKGQDVRALVNHDSNLLIGRAKSGTLRMAEDALGLRIEVDLPDTQLGRDTAESVRRGDMDGMSFSFVCDEELWDQKVNPPERTILHIRDLYDVGPVAFPAYEDTSVAMRSLEALRREAAPPPRPEVVPPPVPDPALSHLRFRIRIEQARVLPAITGVTHESL